MSDSVKRLIDKFEVQRRTSLGRERLRQLELAGDFPKKIQISSRRVGYVSGEVDAWIQARIDASRKVTA